MRKIKLGIVVARPETDTFSELEKHIASEWAEILLFPEGYLPSANLSKVQALAQKYRKWVVTGMDDRRDPARKMQTGIIIAPDGSIAGEHRKTSITRWEVEHGYERGDGIKIIETPLGKLGFAICYEVHFPEVARILALQGFEKYSAGKNFGQRRPELYAGLTQL